MRKSRPGLVFSASAHASNTVGLRDLLKARSSASAAASARGKLSTAELAMSSLGGATNAPRPSSISAQSERWRALASAVFWNFPCARPSDFLCGARNASILPSSCASASESAPASSSAMASWPPAASTPAFSQLSESSSAIGRPAPPAWKASSGVSAPTRPFKRSVTNSTMAASSRTASLSSSAAPPKRFTSAAVLWSAASSLLASSVRTSSAFISMASLVLASSALSSAARSSEPRSPRSMPARSARSDIAGSSGCETLGDKTTASTLSSSGLGGSGAGGRSLGNKISRATSKAAPWSSIGVRYTAASTKSRAVRAPFLNRRAVRNLGMATAVRRLGVCDRSLRFRSSPTKASANAIGSLASAGEDAADDFGELIRPCPAPR
jgi:hypothetical protein